MIESASWIKVSCKPTSENAVGFSFKTSVFIKDADIVVDFTKVIVGIVRSGSS